MSTLVVSGPPGAGKTTVARLLAERAPRGVHLEGDVFFHAIRSGYVPPWQAESSDQNAAVMRATVAAALAFDEGGFSVVVDGIVGPWYLDVFAGRYRASGRELHYVVLRPTLEAALARVAARDEPTIVPPAVEQLHRQLADVGEWEPHVLVVDGLAADQLADTIETAVASGAFRVS